MNDDEQARRLQAFLAEISEASRKHQMNLESRETITVYDLTVENRSNPQGIVEDIEWDYQGRRYREA